MSNDPKFLVSVAVYGAWVLTWLALELTAIFWSGCPWRTLSMTSWDLEAKWKIAKVVFLAGLSVLLVHIVFRWP